MQHGSQRTDDQQKWRAPRLLAEHLHRAVLVLYCARATTIESSRRRILIWLTLQMIPIQIEIACLCHGNKLPPLRSISSSTGFIGASSFNAPSGKCAISWLFSCASGQYRIGATANGNHLHTAQVRHWPRSMRCTPSQASSCRGIVLR